VRDAHSLYLEHLAELGLPGLLALVALLAVLLAAAVRARLRLADPEDVGASTAMTAAFAVFLVSAAVDWQWEVGAVALLGLLAAGIAVASGAEPARGVAGDGPPRVPWVRIAAVTVALAALAIQIPGLIATERLRSSQAAARDGDLEEAEELAADAVEAEPWGASPREQLALALEAQGDYESAEAAIREAMEREPTNWRLPLVLARVQARDGRRQAAKRTFLRYGDLRPLSGYYNPFGPIGREIYTDEELARIAATGSIEAGGAP
jgi:tetratricopeptide (TPR) repeat protein